MAPGVGRDAGRLFLFTVRYSLTVTVTGTGTDMPTRDASAVDSDSYSTRVQY